MLFVYRAKIDNKRRVQKYGTTATMDRDAVRTYRWNGKSYSFMPSHFRAFAEAASAKSQYSFHFSAYSSGVVW